MIWKSSRGIIIKDRIVLDGDSLGGFTFISHAHYDHLPKNKKTRAETSIITREIAKLRDYSISPCLEEEVEYELYDAGHVPGARMIRLNVEDKYILYTGDFSVEGNGLVGGAKPVKSDILIIDATFSYPNYIFPPYKEIAKEIVDWANDNREKKDVYVFAYSFGKAQNICNILDQYSIPYVVDHEIYEANKTLEKYGYNFSGEDIGDVKKINKKKLQEIRENGSVIVAPIRKRNYVNGNSVKAIASGWAVSPLYAKRMNVDIAFPLSDHADYEDILEFIDKVDPSLVLTIQTTNKYFDKIIKEELGIYARILY